MMATPSVDSRIHNDYAISKDISTSNTRKRYNNSENKTKRKYNPASNKSKNDSVKNGSSGSGSGGNYSKKTKQPENSNNSPRTNVNNNPFLVPADVTPRDHLHTPKNSSGSKKQRVDKKTNNVFLTSSTNVGEYSREGRDGRDWKYGKDTDHKPNMFIQNSTSADSFSSSFSTSSVKRNNNMQNRNDNSSSLGNKGSNYFIHNSKIQLNRRQGDDSSFRHSSSTISESQSVPPPPTTVNINIQDVEQFPSLTSSGAPTTSPQIRCPTNIWTKNKLKIKADIAASTETIPAPVVVTPVVKVETITAPIVANVSVYKAKTVSQTTNVLSRDNIFLGAFMKISEPSPDLSCDDNYNNDNTADSNIHIPTSILVDNCDTSYDRFYK
jgi:hypothetical protein